MAAWICLGVLAIAWVFLIVYAVRHESKPRDFPPSDPRWAPPL